MEGDVRSKQEEFGHGTVSKVLLPGYVIATRFCLLSLVLEASLLSFNK